MSWEDVLYRGEKYQLCEQDCFILGTIMGWFNGRTAVEGEKSKHIGASKEPSLRWLVDQGGLVYENFEARKSALDNGGFFDRDDRYIAGTKCDWIPTEDCLMVIEDVFQDYDKFYPTWRKDVHQNPPLFREPNEKMRHRKAVEAASYQFNRLSEVHRSRYYPRLKREVRPDLLVYTLAADPLARVEAIGNHNGARKMFINKYNAWVNENEYPTVWVFPTRAKAVKVLNYTVRQGLDLEKGQFGGDPSNWSVKRINARLRRSREGSENYNSHDVVATTAGLIQSDKERFRELCVRNNI